MRYDHMNLFISLESNAEITSTHRGKNVKIETYRVSPSIDGQWFEFFRPTIPAGNGMGWE